MKLIDQSVTILPQKDLYSQIELAARTCYKSEDKANSDPEEFVERLINANHLAMLEHGTVYLAIDKNKVSKWIIEAIDKNFCNPFSRVTQANGKILITTNYREILNTNFPYEAYLVNKLPEHIARYSFKIITDRATATEILRHRSMSFAMESQRFCNYSKDKFSNEITFIRPLFLKDNTNKVVEKAFITTLEKCEATYFTLLGEGMKPQDARMVLPNSTKTELVVTGFEDSWWHFLDLRLYENTGKVQPSIKEIAQQINHLINIEHGRQS